MKDEQSRSTTTKIIVAEWWWPFIGMPYEAWGKNMMKTNIPHMS